MKIGLNYIRYCLIGTILIVLALFSEGCGTKKSYSVHTVPSDITGTWQGDATRNFIEYDLTLSFVQTEDVVVVIYSLEQQTGTSSGTYSSGNLNAGSGEFRIELLFLMTTATGTMEIDGDEFKVEITKQTN